MEEKIDSEASFYNVRIDNLCTLRKMVHEVKWQKYAWIQFQFVLGLFFKTLMIVNYLVKLITIKICVEEKITYIISDSKIPLDKLYDKQFKLMDKNDSHFFLSSINKID